VVERLAGTRLDSLLSQSVFGRLGLRETGFLPPEPLRDRIAPTEDDPWRGRVLRGEVHDENAARLGGVSGHAGLFSTAHDLARFAFWLLDAWHGRGPAGPLVPAAVVREFTRRHDEPSGSSRALGWDTPSDGSSAGHCLGDASFGHTGFTGTSLWIDPERELVVVLLTNRVHPTRENNAIRRVRPRVADLAVAAVLGVTACPEASRVDTLPGPS
jgi:CubicO group peptidase (beta-lactamase class C family)